jgi:thiamine-phosphate pyrophosphorylase
MYISQGERPEDHLTNIHKVLDAGVLCVQLRIKNTKQETYLQCALKAKSFCSNYGAKLIINDDPFVAEQSHSDALHLGLKDMSIVEARKLAPGKLIGGTANTFEDIQMRYSEKADYIGLGPFRNTNTKEKLSPVLGLEGYAALMKSMREQNIKVPVYAIGGITLTDVSAILDTGVYGIAVSGMLTGGTQLRKTVEEIYKNIEPCLK